MFRLLPIIFIISCSGKYAVNSKPTGAAILVGTQEVGKTPIELNQSQLGPEVAGGFLLRVEMRGYRNLWIWLPKTARSYKLQLNLNPLYQSFDKENSKSNLVFSESKRSDLFKLSALLLEQQMLLLDGAKADEKILTNLLEVNPTLGSINFLNALQKLAEKKNEEAIVLLRDAIRYAPKEADFLALLNELDKTNSDKKPDTSKP